MKLFLKINSLIYCYHSKEKFIYHHNKTNIQVFLYIYCKNNGYLNQCSLEFKSQKPAGTCLHKNGILSRNIKLDVELEGKEDTPTFRGDRDGDLESIGPPHHDSQAPLRFIIFRLHWLLSLLSALHFWGKSPHRCMPFIHGDSNLLFHIQFQL